MNDDELERILREEAEANMDEPLPEGAVGTRPGHTRSTVYSVRLTDAEVAGVQAAADRAGLPSSTLVRSWIVQRLRGDSAAEASLRAMIHEEVLAAVQEAVQKALAS